MSGVFVSQHYKGFDPLEIESYLRQKLGELRPSGDNWVSKRCVFCHDDKGRADNQWKLAFRKDTGAYRCPRCNAYGSFWDFKKSQGDIPQVSDWSGNAVKSPKNYAKPDQSVVGLYPTALQVFPGVSEYFLERKITLETLARYMVGSALYNFPHDPATPNDKPQWKAHLCMTFPWIEHDEKGHVVTTRVKARALDQKSFMRLDPAGGKWGFFGWHTIPAEAREIVITEGEIDAMSVWQATGMPSISLPNGARSLPPELLPYLERFSKIIWWLDDDVPGHEGLQIFAEKVGKHRSWYVRTRQGKLDGPKDANDALKLGHDLQSLLDTAKPVPHEQILTWEDLKDDVLRELVNPGAISGVPSNSLPTYNKILKGHRRGEFTILTGQSGAGKTTVLSQLSLDFCEGGHIPTLWGSFEIKNVRLAKKMLKQFAQKNLEQNLTEFQYWSDRFGHLPLYFMKFFGSTNIDEVLDAAKYCVYALDVAHVVLDNLQFMTSRQAKGGYKFDVQDEAIDKIRAFTTDLNIHTTLVIHPRKVSEQISLDTSMLGGTAKAEQESDTVIVLQRGPNFKFLEVKKNRFDGDLGSIPYTYDKETNRIRELTEQEIKLYQEQSRPLGESTVKKRPPQNFGNKWLRSPNYYNHAKDIK